MGRLAPYFASQPLQVSHHKTGERVWQPPEDEHGKLFPTIEVALAAVPRLGVPMVLTTGRLTKDGVRPQGP